MTTAFALKEQLLLQEPTPLLSVRGIIELLEYYLPRKGLSEEEVFEAIR